MEINKDLLMMQEQWNNVVLLPYVQSHEKHILSRPFYFGVSQEYVEGDCKIMIVGQETRDYGCYSDDWPMPHIQKWGIDYLRRQIWKSGDEDFISKHKLNRSAFWKLFRKIAQRGCVPCWNNVDKIHQSKGKGSTIRLSDEQKSVFCRQYGENMKSLLQREVQLAKPDVVLFATGPHYHLSMTTSVGISEGALDDKKPTPNEVCTDITDIMGLGVPTYWSYHPSFLNRIHKMNECVDMVVRCVGK